MSYLVKNLLRENDIIDHDQDTDICVNAEHLSKELIHSLLSEGFKITRAFGELKDGFEIALERKKIKTDVFFFHKDKTKEGDDFWHYCVYTNFDKEGYYKNNRVFKPFSLVRKTFVEQQFWIPENPEIYLEQQYGETWRESDPKWTNDKKWKFNLFKTGIKLSKQTGKKSLETLGISSKDVL